VYYYLGFSLYPCHCYQIGLKPKCPAFAGWHVHVWAGGAVYFVTLQGGEGRRCWTIVDRRQRSRWQNRQCCQPEYGHASLRHHAARFRFAPSRSRAAPYARRPAQAMQLDSASLHLAHGLRSMQDVRLKPCSSIPLRSISLTGCALYKKKGEVICSCEHDR